MYVVRWVINFVNNKLIDYYEINILLLSKQIYFNKKFVVFQGYDGIVLGLMFIIDKGVEIVVCFMNNVMMDSVIYLYGLFLVRVIFYLI